jgi:uncharacterized protein
MNPDLERLIHLQQLDNALEDARRRIADVPARAAALDQRLATKAAAVDAASHNLAGNQTARRGVEKDLAVVQGRLTKFRDQLMEVKTNKEYQAMQHEIAGAEQGVRGFEDKILELMLEADDIAAHLRAGEKELAEEQRAIDEERRTLESQRSTLESSMQRIAAERARVAAEASPQSLALFDYIARNRKGIAVVEARDGHCSFCQVRLRPQVFNEIRRNESLIQCDSCQRLLYFAPPASAAPTPAQANP